MPACFLPGSESQFALLIKSDNPVQAFLSDPVQNDWPIYKVLFVLSNGCFVQLETDHAAFVNPLAFVPSSVYLFFLCISEKNQPGAFRGSLFSVSLFYV